MHVFTKDGKEEVYPVSDGKEKINDNFRHLKELANQNEIPYSVKGLRELRRLGLVYYLEEKEFDRLYPVMSQGNKNQAQSQKKKEYLRAEKKKVKEYLTAVQKNPNLLLDSRRNPYFDTRKFYEKGSNSNGKEKQLPQLYKGIHDFILPREVPKTSFIMIKKPLNEKTKEEPLKMYVFTSDGEEKIYPVTKQNMVRQLSKLAQENEISYSSKGLRELRRLGLLYYLEEEDFNQLYPIMSQKNKNQAQYQKKKEKEEYLQELEKKKAEQEAERQRQEEEQTRLRKAAKLERDNEATKAHILKYFESTDGQFSARELRTALSKHKLEARNIQSNCEVLIQQGKLEQHKDNMRTVYCLIGRANRMAEQQAQIEAEVRIAQEQQQKREQQIRRLQAEQDQLQRELQSLGIFAFKRKREIQAQLDEVSKQIQKISI